MNKYIILDTEDTRDLCESLIGTICTKVGIKEDHPSRQTFLIMDTLDGELLFTENEVKEIE